MNDLQVKKQKLKKWTNTSLANLNNIQTKGSSNKVKDLDPIKFYNYQMSS